MSNQTFDLPLSKIAALVKRTVVTPKLDANKAPVLDKTTRVPLQVSKEEPIKEEEVLTYSIKDDNTVVVLTTCGSKLTGTLTPELIEIVAQANADIDQLNQGSEELATLQQQVQTLEGTNKDLVDANTTLTKANKEQAAELKAAQAEVKKLTSALEKANSK